MSSLMTMLHLLSHRQNGERYYFHRYLIKTRNMKRCLSTIQEETGVHPMMHCGYRQDEVVYAY
eukprot:872939-Ditylum_brightwellii.AAC.1